MTSRQRRTAAKARKQARTEAVVFLVGLATVALVALAPAIFLFV